MVTPLTKPLKRELQIQGRPFVVTVSAEGIKLTLKGKRKGQELRWEDLVSGEAALAVALNASLKGLPEPPKEVQEMPEADHPAPQPLNDKPEPLKGATQRPKAKKSASATPPPERNLARRKRR